MSDKWLDDIYYELQENAYDAIYDAVTKTLRDAKENAPVDTGYLRRSIFMEIDQSGDSYTGTVYCGAEYGLYLEFGTYKMFAQPFLFPAFERQMAQLEQALRRI